MQASQTLAFSLDNHPKKLTGTHCKLLLKIALHLVCTPTRLDSGSGATAHSCKYWQKQNRHLTLPVGDA
jgi:hypothetical protein